MNSRTERAALACVALMVASSCATPTPVPPATPAPRRAGSSERQAIATGRVRVLLAHRAASARALESASGMAPDAPRERDAIAADELERELGVVDHPAVSELALAVQERIRSACSATSDWRVVVLNVHDEANALSLPSGQVFVTAGLIASTLDEAELAAVVAHELGHVMARHARTHELIRRNVAVAATVGGLDESAAGLSLVTGLGATVVVGEHGRAQELEADRHAALCLARAGYDPDALIDLIDRQRGVSPLLLGSLERSHPSDARRARALRRARAEGVFSSGGSRGDRARHDLVLEALGVLARGPE